MSNIKQKTRPYFYSPLECYADAQNYMQRQRNVEPLVYNQRRLSELPIPDIGNQNVATMNSDDENSLQSFINGEEPIEMSNSENTHATDPLGDVAFGGGGVGSSTNNGNGQQSIQLHGLLNVTNANWTTTAREPERENHFTGLENGTHTPQHDSPFANIVVKSEWVPLFNVHSANNDAIDELLDEYEEVPCDDDCMMIVGSSGFAMPMSATTDDLIKREIDPMSGDMPFNETVRY